jgi:hypothetical protein
MPRRVARVLVALSSVAVSGAVGVSRTAVPSEAVAFPRNVAPSQARQEGAGQGQTVQCAVCHGNTAFLRGKRATAAGDSALFVTDSILRPSVHGGLSCAACHPAFAEGYPHRVDQQAVPCMDCHRDAGREWGRSIHAANVAEGGDAAGCVDCHGSHRVFAPEDGRSTTHALNVAQTCARCHADPEIIGEYFTAPGEAQARRAVSQYYETVHGTAMAESGLVVAATCNDCHRGHEILPSDSGRSSVHRSNIPQTCGQCHVGIAQVYDGSAHGKALHGDGAGAPVCTDCHTSHEIVRTDEPAWFRGVVEECGLCHRELYERYFETYHGKVTRLGFGLTAKCSDCHTAHNMRPVSDPESSVSSGNLVATCARCHPGANENFVRYYAHGDHRDRQRYPVLFWSWLVMTSLLVSVWAFFGLHTVLWFVRLRIDRVRGRHGADDPPPGGSGNRGGEGP